jgi:hypothetical protein
MIGRQKSDTMAMKLLKCVCVLALCTGLSGCGSDQPPGMSSTGAVPARPQTVDLDKVLKILSETLNDLDVKAISQASPEELQDMGSKKLETADNKPKLTGKLDKAKEEMFVKDFAANLNKAHLINEPIGVSVLNDGTILGFADPNGNNVKDANDRDLFKVMLDEKGGRLIASDGSNRYHRDQHYGFSPFGFFAGYLMGSMLSRQQVSGFDTRRFSSMQMSPQGYHGKMMQQAPSAAGTPRTAPAASGVTPKPTAPPAASSSGSARTSGRSGGFSGGK